MLDLSAIETVLYAGGVTLIFSTAGGFRGVVYTDFILFFTCFIDFKKPSKKLFSQ